MRKAMKPFGIGLFVASALASSAIAQTVAQEDEDNTRSVRIIEAPIGAPAVPAPAVPPPSSSPEVGVPAEELPQLSAPATPAPASVPQAAVAPPPVPAVSSAVPNAVSPNYSVMSAPPSAELGAPPKYIDLAALEASIRVANPAELSVEIVPGQEFAVGSRVSFQISTKKAGYLILLDVDAAGKLTQIYPNPSSLMLTSANQQHANYVKPGKPIQIPNPAEARSFEFVAAPPFGTAMVVAFLSDRPVQMVNLPDVPVSMTGQASALTFLTKLAGDLRIPESGEAGRLEAPHWSFDAKFYAIR
jgi:hypothetical protein